MVVINSLWIIYLNNIFELLASTQYETDNIKTNNKQINTSHQNVSEVINQLDYNCDTQHINVIPSNIIEFTKTTDLDTGKNSVSNGSCLMNKESDIESGAIVTNYVHNISDVEKTSKQETEKSQTSSMFKEMNEANRHERENVIDKTESINLSNSEKAPEQEIANTIMKPKLLSLPVLIKAIDLQKESVIRKLDTRSLHDDTYMTLQQKSGNKINIKFTFLTKDEFWSNCILYIYRK